MINVHLKQGLRLNRTLGFCLLTYELAGFFYTEHFWDHIRLGIAAGLALVFLGINELVMKKIKQSPNQVDQLMVEKSSILIPLFSMGLVFLSYIITGQLAAYALGLYTMLQAQLFGHNSLARVMLVLFLVTYAATLPLGYPHLLGFNHLPGQPFLLFLWLIPFMVALTHYGNVVGSMVRTTSTRVMKLKSLASTDGLTGLINRRQFNHQLQSEVARAKRYRIPLSLALFDIDDFKKINDVYGHPTGDRILKELGQTIQANIRESDVPARYGGEEFALILPETSQSDAYELLERLRQIVQGTVFCLPDNPLTITISVGVAQLDHESKDFELVEVADVALYEAKKQGKNQVVYGIVPTPKVSYQSFETK